jgi:plastocyanin domain-containing protein
MKNILIVVFALASLAAAPKDSGYSKIPKKREALGSNSEVRDVREESVRPEEVYKYGVQEFAVIAGDTGFFPQRLIVRRNIPVRIFLTSSSSKALCFIMDEFSIKKGFASQAMEEVRFLPTKAGQYKFYCPVQEIEGSIIVRD